MSTPSCDVQTRQLACGDGVNAACILADRFRFPALAIEQRGDINTNAMIHGGDGLGKLVAAAEDMYDGSPVFLKCSPPPDGRGTVFYHPLIHAVVASSMYGQIWLL